MYNIIRKNTYLIFISFITCTTVELKDMTVCIAMETSDDLH